MAERFIRSVKEECLALRFENFDQAQAQIADFIDLYNRERLIERLGYRTPAAAHRELFQQAA